MAPLLRRAAAKILQNHPDFLGGFFLSSSFWQAKKVCKNIQQKKPKDFFLLLLVVLILGSQNIQTTRDFLGGFGFFILEKKFFQNIKNIPPPNPRPCYARGDKGGEGDCSGLILAPKRSQNIPNHPDFLGGFGHFGRQEKNLAKI